MTTVLLKLPVALKEDNLNSTVNQDHLVRKNIEFNNYFKGGKWAWKECDLKQKYK